MADPVRLVVWDCDGVLVDSEPLAAQVLAEFLTELGIPHTREDCFERYTGISMKAVIAMVERDFGAALPLDFEIRIRERDDHVFRTELQPMDGVRKTVTALPAAHCVASSGTPAKIDRSLTVTGLKDLFVPNLFSACMVPRGKPAPDLFLFAADRMGTTPEACIVVEDSPAGVAAGRAAGMRTVGFVGGGHCGPGHGEALRDAGADTVIARLTDLPELLGVSRVS